MLFRIALMNLLQTGTEYNLYKEKFVSESICMQNIDRKIKEK